VSTLFALFGLLTFIRRLMPVPWFCSTTDVRATVAVAVIFAVYLVTEFTPVDFESLIATIRIGYRFTLAVRASLRLSDEIPPSSILLFRTISPRPPPTPLASGL
jgi:hypothetical protein